MNGWIESVQPSIHPIPIWFEMDFSWTNLINKMNGSILYKPLKITNFQVPTTIIGVLSLKGHKRW